MSTDADGGAIAGTVRRLPKTRLEDLIQHLWQQGFRVLGPVPRNGGIVFDEVRRVADLPIGLREEQQPGRYRLVAGVPGEIFGVVNGPGFLKPSFFAPEEPLLQVHKQRRGFRVDEVKPPSTPLASSACAPATWRRSPCRIAIFLHDRVRDPHYAARREHVLLIAVDCTRAAATCFCASMGTGPEATRGYDLALTELDDGFVVQSGSAGRGGARRGAVPGRRRPRARSSDARARIASCADEHAAPPRHRGPARRCCTRSSSIPAGTTSRSAACPAPTARWSARPASVTRGRRAGARRQHRASACASGTRASPSSTRTSTARTSARTSASATASG